MLCGKCMGKTRVLETRATNKEFDHPAGRKLVAFGDTLFGWWSLDFEVRRRLCRKCGAIFKTIEVSTDDLLDAFDEIQQNRSLGRPWMPRSSKDLPRLNAEETPKLGDKWRSQSNLCGN